MRERGVYVRKGRGIQVANELHKAVHEDSPWPDDDPDKPELVLRATIPAPPTAVTTTIPTPAAITTTYCRHYNPSTPSTTTTTEYGRELGNLAKMYEGKMKYGGAMDNFNHKYSMIYAARQISQG